MYRILREAISRLSELTNISAGLSHPLDESRAKELFRALHLEGVTLDYTSIKNLALENHWPDHHSTELAELGQKIGAGSRVVVKHPSGWGEQTVREIMAKIKKS
jgi:hypothetical protein